jgi:hypothetical protein
MDSESAVCSNTPGPLSQLLLDLSDLKSISVLLFTRSLSMTDVDDAASCGFLARCARERIDSSLRALAILNQQAIAPTAPPKSARRVRRQKARHYMASTATEVQPDNNPQERIQPDHYPIGA